MSDPPALWPPGAVVTSAAFGSGRVEVDRRVTALVRFKRGFEEFVKGKLMLRPMLASALVEVRFDPAFEVAGEGHLGHSNGGRSASLVRACSLTRDSESHRS